MISTSIIVQLRDVKNVDVTSCEAIKSAFVASSSFSNYPSPRSFRCLKVLVELHISRYHSYIDASCWCEMDCFDGFTDTTVQVHVIASRIDFLERFPNTTIFQCSIIRWQTIRYFPEEAYVEYYYCWSTILGLLA